MNMNGSIASPFVWPLTLNVDRATQPFLKIDHDCEFMSFIITHLFLSKILCTCIIIVYDRFYKLRFFF